MIFYPQDKVFRGIHGHHPVETAAAGTGQAKKNFLCYKLDNELKFQDVPKKAESAIYNQTSRSQ